MRFSEFLAVNGAPLRLATGAHVFRQGDSDRRMVFIQQGVLKAYYLTEDGRERIKSFHREGDFIGSLRSGAHGEACPFSLLALEDCALARFSFSDLNAAARADSELAKEMMDALIALALKKERREYEFLCLSAEERYLEMRRRSPELLQRVKQADLASFLGITPVALSRIRRRLAKLDP